MTDAHDTPVPRRATRAADADREDAAEQLRTAVAEGRLDLGELDDRLSAIYTAKTLDELEVITADLPAPRVPDNRPLTLQTKSGSLKKVGYWSVPSHIVIECTSGSVKLDFTQAVCSHREVTIEATVASGSLVMIVPDGWVVDLDDVSTTSGSLADRVKLPPEPGAPMLRVSGQVRSGSIVTRYPRRSFWEWLLRRDRPGRPR